MFNYGPADGSKVHSPVSFKKFKEKLLTKFKFVSKNHILIWEKDNYENMLKSYSRI